MFSDARKQFRTSLDIPKIITLCHPQGPAGHKSEKVPRNSKMPKVTLQFTFYPLLTCLLMLRNSFRHHLTLPHTPAKITPHTSSPQNVKNEKVPRNSKMPKVTPQITFYALLTCLHMLRNSFRHHLILPHTPAKTPPKITHLVPGQNFTS